MQTHHACSDMVCCVQAEVYKLYGKAYGWYSIIALCFFWASEQSTNILTSWWLSQWATAQILYQVEQALGMRFIPLPVYMHVTPFSLL